MPFMQKEIEKAMVQPEAQVLRKPKTPEEMMEAKAEAMTMLSQINYILGRIQESNEGFMNTSPETPSPDKKSVSRVLFPSPKMAQDENVKKWLFDKYGEDGNRIFRMMIEDGAGVHTFFTNTVYPCKGFHYNDTVEIVDEVKKTLMGFLRGFFGGMKRNPIKMVVFLLFFRGQFQVIFNELLMELNTRLGRVQQKPQYYCMSGRELYRTFNKMIIWYPRWKTQIEYIRNIVCMIWEYDDAYRYPAQDVFEEFNPENARKDIIGEIRRLINVYMERDFRGTSLKFERISKLLVLIRCMPKYRQALERFFLELDINQIKLDEADCYHSQYKWGYDWKAGKAYQKYQIVNPDGEPDSDIAKAKSESGRVVEEP